MIAVLLLSSGALAMSLAVLVSASWYADSVNSREIRIQTRFNREACIQTVEMLIQKNFFLSGEVDVPWLGCKAFISNDFNGNTSIVINSIRL